MPPADIATFGLSNTTDISISEDTEVNGIIFTPDATNPYSITVNAGLTLTVSGVGIVNNSASPFLPIFYTGLDGGNGQIRFTNSSTAGNVFIQNYSSEATFALTGTRAPCHTKTIRRSRPRVSIVGSRHSPSNTMRPNQAMQRTADRPYA